MIIGFDAKRLFQNYTGLGNYSRFLVRALGKNFPEHEYVLFAPAVRWHPDTSEFASGTYKVVTPGGLGRFVHPVWRSFTLSLTKSARRLDIFHGLSHELPYGLPDKVKKVVTVHDLIFYRYPEYYKKVDVAIYKQKVKSACQRAHRIVAISHQTAQDIHDFLGVPSEKITVVYQGCHPRFMEKIPEEGLSEIRKKYNLPSRYLLNVGTIERRKNIKTVIEALALIPENLRIPLVIVGRKTAYADEVLDRARQLHVASFIHIIDNLPFPDLPAIYQAADVFLYPSLFEGFGIPVIEAIWSGVPVITSTGSCFSEAGGPHSLYASPVHPQSWAEAILKLLSDSKLRAELSAASLNYVQQFRPEVIARDMMGVYTSLF